ncbi:MAG: dihydrodipicolinate synthase family protein [Planctomycetaceae bacterium]|nr:dihydrodipicolinate synthase family protein [Planctomycetaceae bacterium]
MFAPLRGLIAATHTPFHADGSLNVDMVERQAEHLIRQKVPAAFICGSTGESHSLTLDERRQLAVRWMDVTRGTQLGVVVHVGTNCLADARELAAQAQELGAQAIAMLTPSYFKPATVDVLVECCCEVAQAAADLPFYYYDIPPLTGVNLSMPAFLEAAVGRIPNLAGLKFTNVDLMAFQICRATQEGRFDILWGVDEMLLGALACGAEGAVGSTYNFAAEIYHRIWQAFTASDWETARTEQLRSIRLIQTLASRGYFASAKVLMERQGVAVGAPRLPHRRLSADERRALETELEAIGF